jgi:hypothetical protein
MSSGPSLRYENHCAYVTNLEVSHDRCERNERSVYELYTITETGEPLTGDNKSLWVSIDTDKSAVGSSFEEQGGVPSSTEGGINDGSSRYRLDGGDEFVGHNRVVLEVFACI